MGEWVHKKLGDESVSKIIMGQSPSSTTYNDENIGMPFLQGCADFGDIYPKVSVFCKEPLKVAPENSILMSVRAPVGALNRANVDYIIGRGLCSIIPNVDKDFLYYYLLQNRNKLEVKAQGSTFLAINSSEINNFEIFFPESLSEQRRIASILSSADKVIDSTQKLIAKYKSIKQGMMEDLLKPKEGWKKVKLGECCEKITDGSHESPVAVLEGYYMPSVKDMSYSSFNFSNCKQISESDYLKLKGLGCKPEIGDVLIAKDGSILKYCFVMEDDLPIVILSSIAILKPNKQIMDSNFLSFYFQKRDVVIDVVENYKSGTGVPRIVLKNFEQIEITYPISLIEQRRIASILSSIDKKIESEEKVLEKYKNIKKGLMEKLLKGE